MDPVVESALISAAATLVGVGGTAAVALAGFRFSRRTLDDTRDGQLADRYTKAIEQLGSSTIDVTIGGIYALERIAFDSPRDHPTVMEVLAACIREHSDEPLREPTAGPARTEPEPDTRPDIQAAVTVIGRRDAKYDRGRINLRGVHLPYADLPEVNLASADLAGANLNAANLRKAKLSDADLTEANLSGARLRSASLVGAGLTTADLRSADLTGADLTGADLREAKLADAKLRSAKLAEAKLTGAGLRRADLTDADLTGADLSATFIEDPFTDEVESFGVNLIDANLRGANLTHTILTGASLTGADLTGADLAEADLTDTKWPAGAPVPMGWVRDPDSDRLGRASAGSRPTEAE